MYNIYTLTARQLAFFRERQCELGKQSARADRECSVNRDLGGETHKVSGFVYPPVPIKKNVI